MTLVGQEDTKRVSEHSWDVRRVESEFAGDRHETVVDSSAKYTNTEVAGLMIQKRSANTSGVVAFPS
jgi:hypothetical protein